MMVFYTLQGQIYDAKDVERALQLAEAASTKYSWPVRALIETLAQKNVFIGVSGFTFQVSNRFRFNSISGAITTRKQCQSGLGELIVVVCPTIQLLQKIQDHSTNIELLIVVPEMKSDADVYEWLDLNSAKDITSGVTLNNIGLPATGIKRAINYLRDYCKRNTVDLTHYSVQTGEMADVVNTIKTQSLTANDKEVIKYCLQKGIPYIEAEILAKAFTRRTLLPTRGCPNYAHIWNSINNPKWDY